MEQNGSSLKWERNCVQVGNYVRQVKITFN